MTLVVHYYIGKFGLNIFLNLKSNEIQCKKHWKKKKKKKKQCKINLPTFLVFWPNFIPVGGSRFQKFLIAYLSEQKIINSGPISFITLTILKILIFCKLYLFSNFQNRADKISWKYFLLLQFLELVYFNKKTLG